MEDVNQQRGLDVEGRRTKKRGNFKRRASTKRTREEALEAPLCARVP